MKNPFEFFKKIPKKIEGKISILEPNHKELSMIEIKKLLFLSYMFSQGYPPLQKKLLEFMKYYYGPQKMISNLEKEELNNYIFDSLDSLSKKKTHQDVAPGVSEGPAQDEDTIQSDPLPSSYANILFTESTDLDYKKNLENIIENIISRDFKFMSAGRPNRFDHIQDKYNIKSKYFSFTVHYFIRENKTGDESLDSLFKISRSILKNINSGKYLYRLMQIITKYNEKYPGQKITIDELDRLGISVKL